MKSNVNKTLWEGFLQDEPTALSRLYHRNIQQLYSYGRKFSHDDELIKDIIQELFIDLIKSRQKLNSVDNVSFYLMTSLRRKLAKHINKNKAFTYSEDHNINAEIVYSIENDIIDEEELSQKERLIKEALSKLSKKQREILYYKYTCDFSYDQICEIMSIKYDSARKQVFRALKTLKDSLGGIENLILFLALYPSIDYFLKKR